MKIIAPLMALLFLLTACGGSDPAPAPAPPAAGTEEAEKPVGLVHFAAAAKDGRLIHREQRYGDIGRSEVRRLSVIEALTMLLELAA